MFADGFLLRKPKEDEIWQTESTKVTCTVYNINPGNNEDLKKRSQTCLLYTSAWNVTYFIDVIYGADMHYYISMKRGFIMTPETEIVKKQILSTENAEILLEENEAKRY